MIWSQEFYTEVAKLNDSTDNLTPDYIEVGTRKFMVSELKTLNYYGGKVDLAFHMVKRTKYNEELRRRARELSLIHI